MINILRTLMEKGGNMQEQRSSTDGDKKSEKKWKRSASTQQRYNWSGRNSEWPRQIRQDETGPSKKKSVSLNIW